MLRSHVFCFAIPPLVKSNARSAPTSRLIPPSRRKKFETSFSLPYTLPSPFERNFRINGDGDFFSALGSQTYFPPLPPTLFRNRTGGTSHGFWLIAHRDLSCRSPTQDPFFFPFLNPPFCGLHVTVGCPQSSDFRPWLLLSHSGARRATSISLASRAERSSPRPSSSPRSSPPFFQKKPQFADLGPQLPNSTPNFEA